LLNFLDVNPLKKFEYAWTRVIFFLAGVIPVQLENLVNQLGSGPWCNIMTFGISPIIGGRKNLDEIAFRLFP